MTVTADQVATFLGKPGDAATIATAQQALPIVTVMVRAYTRGRGFEDEDGYYPELDLEAVILTAAARLAANPSGIPTDQTAGPFSQSIRGAFGGWNVAELAVLNRHRKRAT